MSRKRSGPWPRLPQSLVAQILAGHSALGLAFAALIYLVCVTGTLDVFVAELRGWEQPSAPVAAPSPAAFDFAVAEALKGGGGPGKVAAIYAMAPRTGAGVMSVSAYGAGGQREWLADPAGAGLRARHTPWTDFLDRTHMYLGLPTTPGLLLVGAVGAALLSLLLSGVLAHPRILRDAFTLRLGGGKRLQEADLHNRLSVWALPFHLVVTLTGTFFGLANLMVLAVATAGYGGDVAKAYAPLTGPAVTADPRPAPLPPTQVLLARIPGGATASEVTFVGAESPGTAGVRMTVEVAAPGRLTRGERFFFDAGGRFIGSGGYRDGGFGAQAYAAAAGLHFGSFGGLPVRLVYGLLGAALCVVTASGVSIWLARRRDRGRPCPRLEAAWLGAVWGVLIALAAAAELSMLAAVPPLPAFWTLLAMLLAAAQLAGDPRRLAQSLRGGLGGLLLALAASNLACSLPATLLQAAVDAALTATGAGLLLHLAMSRPRLEPPPAATTLEA